MAAKDEPKHSWAVADWISKTGIAVVLTFAISTVGGWTLFANYYKQKIELERKVNELVGMGEVVKQIADQWPETQRKLGVCYAFTEQWPAGTWEGATQIPIDGKQNRRLDEVESVVDVLRQHYSQHCENARDAGDKGQSCVGL